MRKWCLSLFFIAFALLTGGTSYAQFDYQPLHEKYISLDVGFTKEPVTIYLGSKLVFKGTATTDYSIGQAELIKIPQAISSSEVRLILPRRHFAHTFKVDWRNGLLFEISLTGNAVSISQERELPVLD